ncbi:hypothetical protein HK405_007815 [Cladochytrium tenue]|nr:hypothetical protein HK405_007815 [Cladochytrium tenue]
MRFTTKGALMAAVAAAALATAASATPVCLPSDAAQTSTAAADTSATATDSTEASATATATAASDDSGWAAAKARAAALVAEMTLEEMVRVVSGAGSSDTVCSGTNFAVERLGLRALCLNDGPTGPRSVDGASAFSASLNAAATFDKDLMLERGELIGEEFYGKGIDIALGPDLNMAHAPLAGRNWEGQGADPYLTAISAGLQVRGIQSKRVVATAKHFVGNEQETWRLHTNSVIDEKTLREIYLRPFQYAVQREGAAAIMHSYNMLNGVHMGENERLLTDILKGEWGFNGLVMSDWLATTNRTEAAVAGTDMLMPGNTWDTVCNGGELVAFSFNPDYPLIEAADAGWCWGINLVQDVGNGTVTQTRVADAATRVLSSLFYVGLAATGDRTISIGDAGVNVQRDHRKHIRAAGAASIVVAKNSGVLPLSAKSVPKVALIGSDAGPSVSFQTYSVDTYGHVPQGGGSGATRFPYVVTPLDAFARRAADENFAVKYALNDTDLDTAASIAQLGDVALVFVKSYSSEGWDRYSYDLDSNGVALINAVASVHSNTVVVLNVPGPVDMSWVDNSNITAVVFAMYPGQESGNSLVDVLYGDYNPSGRLPFTVANDTTDYTVSTVTTFTLPNGTALEWSTPNAELYIAELPQSQQPKVNYSEGLFFDYRYFDRAGVEPLYAFGHGLSYTTFAYADATVVSASELGVDVTVSVSNTGSVGGHEVVQLYLGYPESAAEPVKQLKAFEKVYVPAGESATVTLSVDSFFLPVWDASAGAWTTPSGTYTVYVGASSGDIRQTATFDL